jgi:serine phosphatase RsbU (regulator of sigma subunit)
LVETNRKLVAATAFIEAEVDRIAAIQKCLLPPPNPDVPGLEVAAWSETYDRVGGDHMTTFHSQGASGLV